MKSINALRFPGKACCTAAVALLLLSASCGGDKKASSQYPANFAAIGDAGRVAWMMGKTTPDSVARFIIYGAIGKVPGAKIDTLAIATNYAYEKYKGEELDKFSAEYEDIISSLPLGEKMTVYKLGGSEDPQGLGYRLGLEYMATIRDGHLKVADIEKELKAFREACANDTDTYRRFIVGFKTVLRVDSGKDIPADVYQHFINY